MELSFGSKVEEFRVEVRDLLQNFIPREWAGAGRLERPEFEILSEELRRMLYEAGCLGLAWPEEYGGGGKSIEYDVVVAEELTRYGLPQGVPNDVFGIQMFGNTLLAFGNEEQKRLFLPRILSGEDRWCQGYSEPQAGSDLASVITRAKLDGDSWIINGQKIWTSEAHRANWIFVLVRTNADVEKHQGLTLMACPLRQEGIEIKPIRQMTNTEGFNEVFFSDAVTSTSNVIGSVNDGWRVATTLLEFERGGAAAVLAPRFEEELMRVKELARLRGRNNSELVRQSLAWSYARVAAMRLMGYKALERYAKGLTPGVGAALTKLYWTEYHAKITELALELLGEQSLAACGRKAVIPDGPDAVGSPQDSAGWIDAFLFARASTIYAGSSEIQRNLLSERVLSMPRESKRREDSVSSDSVC